MNQPTPPVPHVGDGPPARSKVTGTLAALACAACCALPPLITAGVLTAAGAALLQQTLLAVAATLTAAALVMWWLHRRRTARPAVPAEHDQGCGGRCASGKSAPNPAGVGRGGCGSRCSPVAGGVTGGR